MKELEPALVRTEFFFRVAGRELLAAVMTNGGFEWLILLLFLLRVEMMFILAILAAVTFLLAFV